MLYITYIEMYRNATSTGMFNILNENDYNTQCNIWFMPFMFATPTKKLVCNKSNQSTQYLQQRQKL